MGREGEASAGRGQAKGQEVMRVMQSQNQFAFKEWAVICAALASGRQTLILRKGGIHESCEGFRVEHCEFWLFPTAFHQKRDEVLSDAWPLLEEVQSRGQPPQIELALYAVVEEVHHVTDRAALSRLSGRHLWSEATVEQRFEYRSPGLFALVVRIFRHPTPIRIAESPHLAGCKSWVDLPTALPTSGLQPVLDDTTFDRQRHEIQHLLAGESAGYLTSP